MRKLLSSDISRRGMLLASGAALAASALSNFGTKAARAEGASSIGAKQGAIVGRDGTKLFVQETGQGRPIVFVHGWSINSDVWREQFAGLASSARCIAYDRRGHGRSDKPEAGYDYDTLASDFASVLDQLAVTGATVVAHSMAGGEVVRYLTRNGPGRVARIVLIAPTLPRILQGPDNPQGLPMVALDKLRAALTADYAGYIRANARSFFTLETPQTVVDWGMSLSLQCSTKAAIACTHTYSEAVFRGELPQIAVPTLILHGDKDSLPIDLTSRRVAETIKGSTLKIYPGGPHGVFITHKDAVNADLAAFARG